MNSLKLKFDNEAKKLDEFVKEKLQPLFGDPRWKGSAVFVYENSHGKGLSLNVRNFWEEVDRRKACYRLQPVDGRRGVFFPLIDSSAYWNDAGVNAVIVEGEINWLQLMAQWARWREARGGQDFTLAGMAVGGKCGADVHTIAKLMEGYPPTVVYDNDALDDETGKPGGYTLVETVNWKVACYAVTTRTKGMDDYIKQCNPSPEDLKKLLDSAEYLPRPFEAVKEDIDKATKDGRSRFVEREVTDIRFQIAHVREQGTDLIMVLVNPSFENESTSKQNKIVAELQLRARSAGLAGTVVLVWMRGNAAISMAPKAWHPFFQNITPEWVSINISRELFW